MYQLKYVKHHPSIASTNQFT